MKNVKKVLIVANTTQERFQKKKELTAKWGKDHQITAADLQNAIGVFDAMAHDIIVICPAPGSLTIYEQLEGKISGKQLIFRDGYDTLPATI